MAGRRNQSGGQSEIREQTETCRPFGRRPCDRPRAFWLISGPCRNPHHNTLAALFGVRPYNDHVAALPMRVAACWRRKSCTLCGARDVNWATALVVTAWWPSSASTSNCISLIARESEGERTAAPGQSGPLPLLAPASALGCFADRRGDAGRRFHEYTP
jgi:hypothetical protein